MSSSASNINRLWADLIVEELVRNGVRHFFLAPGSRSSPLVVAIAQHSMTEATIHFDERGAAFAALGCGRGSGSPAAWITTSGTAAANGLPAVVEAAQSHVPLIAITADRPPELRDTGANQAIDQIRLFGTYPRWFFDFPCPSVEIDSSFVLTTVDQAVHRATGSPAGPIHLNCPYREPLAPSKVAGKLPEIPDRWVRTRSPYTAYRIGAGDPDAAAISQLLDQVRAVRRGIIIVGELPTLEDARAVTTLASEFGWPVVADVTSQMRLGDAPPHVVRRPHFVCAANAGAAEPELVLRLGGPVSSKEIRSHADSVDARIVAVVDHPERRDPGHRVSTVIRASTQAFCRALAGAPASPDRDWLDAWTEVDERIDSALRDQIGSLTEISEPGVAAAVTRLLPEDNALFVASSMPIRDVDMFGSSSGALRRVAANRGASGIDGTAATSFGYHLGAGCPVTLLIGDLALLHDLNSLALVQGRPIVVVAINNGGGGIFNFLPIADHAEVFEPWFTSPHIWSFEHAAAMFGIHYDRPGSPSDFERSYTAAIQNGRAALIEVVTERRSNRLLHADLRAHALEAAYYISAQPKASQKE
ncbi:MAG TPA: 2-succinyl-5-enolpyruvyl-6-hydroxy-3-cyclohexene-1-carboxylic-acid synthase [Rhodothermales bacterium]|nr:2-succinyl-5-enolpyruvyl-6-hydroxy-3-cyclohexene-1-carboxylic-acid synthase [Rhodothermales bacterium]